jgi:hypothetical protein
MLTEFHGDEGKKKKIKMAKSKKRRDFQLPQFSNFFWQKLFRLVLGLVG